MSWSVMDLQSKSMTLDLRSKSVTLLRSRPMTLLCPDLKFRVLSKVKKINPCGIHFKTFCMLSLRQLFDNSTVIFECQQFFGKKME